MCCQLYRSVSPVRFNPELSEQSAPTGAWANDINKLVGLSVPLVAMKHAYVVTEKIPGIENMPNVRDHDASVYLKLQGDALQVGGYEVDPIFIEKVVPATDCVTVLTVDKLCIFRSSLREISPLDCTNWTTMCLVSTLRELSTGCPVWRM